MTMETIEQIMNDEGYSDTVYLCPAGKLTWLYGRNIEDRPITHMEWVSLSEILKNGGTQEQWADELFCIDCNAFSDVIHNVFNIQYGKYPETVFKILLNMLYNMGETKFNPQKWPNFFRAIKDRNWKQAAVEGRDSRWFHQVGQRSVRLMKSLENVTET